MSRLAGGRLRRLAPGQFLDRLPCHETVTFSNLVNPGIRTPAGVIGLGGMLLATRLATKRNLLNQIFAALVIVVAFYVLYKNGVAGLRPLKMDAK